MKNSNMEVKRVLSAGYSDVLGALCEAMANQESVFKMFLRF